jgi:SNF2 family DNA or RNA helicase
VITEIQKELKPGIHFFLYEWGTFLCVSTSEEALKELGFPGAPEIIQYAIGSETIYMANIGDELGEQLNLEESIAERSPAFYFHGAAEERLLTLCRRAHVRARTAHMATPTYAPSEQVLEHAPELRDKLYPHQRTAVEWFVEIGHGLLGDDMGLGKTISVLASFSELRWKGDVEKMVIVCPNSLVKNWLKEAKVWLPNLRFETPPKGATFRRSFFRKLQSYDYCDAVVVNFESFRSPQVLTPLMEWVQSHETFLCIDESQRAKNPQSKSFEALRKIAPHARRRILLSGTPAPRDLSDLWTQIFLIDLGERFGGDFFRWLDNIAVLGNRYSKMAVLEYKEREVERVKLRVREVLLRRRKEQVVNLPEKIFSTRYIEMSGSQKRRYDEVCKSLRVRMTSMNGKAFYRDIDNTLEEFLRAVQIASNPRLVDETYSDTPAKFRELDQLLEELVEEQEEKVVVWTNYLGNVRELVKRYGKYGARAFSGEQGVHERDEAVEQFQERKSTCRVLIAVPAAGGVGITLTAAKTAIYLDKTWNGEHWLQSIDRVHRIGQEGVVHIVSLESGRVDALISSNLDRKELFLRELLDGEASRDELYPSREELLEALGDSE